MLLFAKHANLQPYECECMHLLSNSYVKRYLWKQAKRAIVGSLQT